jgi:hypothetical protein
MINLLKELSFKTLPTLNLFVDKVKAENYIISYNNDLKKNPKITDFINFDLEGFEINDNKPVFKGWKVCEESSSDNKKVPKLTTKYNEYRIYFDTDSGVIIASLTNMCDYVTYNDLAIFFEGKLKIN